ncbi:hypothetical protein [Megasphaera vaginalis (ex Srinivasan et al. 2021)]|nr:hypothetical protein [Megasphaera vaginalis (ex Srinivasan et al. 2021)]
MEPFDLDNLKECEFAYVAGHRVKVSDLDEAEVSERMTAEAEANYRIRMEQLWGTKSINLNTEIVPVIEFPVLLSGYYLISGNIEAAVNGQTGKVSVLAEKYSSYLSVPWWFQGIVVLLVASGATFGAILLGGLPLMDSIYLTGVLGFSICSYLRVCFRMEEVQHSASAIIRKFSIQVNRPTIVKMESWSTMIRF